MTLTFDEIEEMVLNRFDPEDIVDALEITAEDLTDIPNWEERLMQNIHKFGDMEGDE